MLLFQNSSLNFFLIRNKKITVSCVKNILTENYPSSAHNIYVISVFYLLLAYNFLYQSEFYRIVLNSDNEYEALKIQ